jgi:MHS family citrate/tricarballylate:H+ symporter-like MFS transporter
MLIRNWSIVLIGVMLVTMTTVSFYLITAYTPTFGKHELRLAPMTYLTVTYASASQILSGCR